MHTLFGEKDESELDAELELDHDVPPAQPGAPSIQRIVSKRWYLKGTKILARADVQVECKPAAIGAAPGVL